MGPEMIAEIHFHNKQQASCLLTTTWNRMDAVRSEIVLLSYLIHRQLGNLGQEFAPRVGRMLSALKAPEFRGAAISTYVGSDILGELSSLPDPGPALLASHPGQASKRFIARLTDDSFRMDAKGFGLFGKQLLFYAPMSLSVLVEFLASRRRDEDAYLAAIADLLNKVAPAAERGAVTVKNQSQLSLAAAFEALAKAGLVDDAENS